LIETEKLNKVKERIALTQQKYQKAKQELDYGDISNFDLLNFKNALLQDSVRFHQQEAQLKEAAIKKSRLLTFNQDIKNRFTNMKLNENIYEQTKAQRRPTLRLRGRVSEELGTTKVTDRERRNGGTFDSFLNFTFNYNLIDGGRMRRKIDEAKVKQLIAGVEVEQARNEISEKLLTFYYQYEQRRKVLAVNQRLINNLRKNQEIAYERLLGGYSVFIEYRDIQLKLMNAEFDQLETMFELKIAETEIIRLIGGLTRSN